MASEILTKENYEKIRSCMPDNFYQQTVQDFGHEPTNESEYKTFVEMYLHNDNVDRNAEIRKEHLKEHPYPPLSLMQKDTLEYDRLHREAFVPIKNFTDVVREEVGIDMHANLKDILVFEEVEPENQEQREEQTEVHEYPFHDAERNEQLYFGNQGQQLNMQTRMMLDFSLRVPKDGSFDISMLSKENESFNCNCNFIETIGLNSNNDITVEAFNNDLKKVMQWFQTTDLSNYNKNVAIRVDTDKFSYMISNKLINSFNSAENKDEKYSLIGVTCYDKGVLEEHRREARKGVRFPDSSTKFTDNYRDRFPKLEDGDDIKIVSKDGNSRLAKVRYIDETHAKIGGDIMHIDQFAESIDYSGAEVIPLRDSLPNWCFIIAQDEDGIDKVAVFEKGQKEVKEFEEFNDDVDIYAIKDKLNGNMNIAEEQAQAMQSAYDLGWDSEEAVPKKVVEKESKQITKNDIHKKLKEKELSVKAQVDGRKSEPFQDGDAR